MLQESQRAEISMFNNARWVGHVIVAIPLLIAGCAKAPEKQQASANAPAPAPEEDTSEDAVARKANLAKLSPEDRKIAEAQRFCAIEEENPLGGMGKPLKVMIKGKPVFLCCGGCRKQALAEPDKTLAKAEELRKKSGVEK
jgi:hypothetical protein